MRRTSKQSRSTKRSTYKRKSRSTRKRHTTVRRKRYNGGRGYTTGAAAELAQMAPAPVTPYSYGGAKGLAWANGGGSSSTKKNSKNSNKNSKKNNNNSNKNNNSTKKNNNSNLNPNAKEFRPHNKNKNKNNVWNAYGTLAELRNSIMTNAERNRFERVQNTARNWNKTSHKNMDKMLKEINAIRFK